MILRTYASNQPLSLVFIPITVVAVVVAAVIRGVLIPVNVGFPADFMLKSVYTSPWSLGALVAVLILAGAIMSNVVFNRHEFYNTPVFIPALMYAMMATTLSLIQLSVPLLLANVFALLGLNRHLKIFLQPRVLAEYFEERCVLPAIPDSGCWSLAVYSDYTGFSMARICTAGHGIRRAFRVLDFLAFLSQ